MCGGVRVKATLLDLLSLGQFSCSWWKEGAMVSKGNMRELKAVSRMRRSFLKDPKAT